MNGNDNHRASAGFMYADRLRDNRGRTAFPRPQTFNWLRLGMLLLQLLGAAAFITIVWCALAVAQVGGL